MDEILTAREVAKYLKLNERTVLKLAGERALPGVKIGGQWRFRRSVIDRWLDLRIDGSELAAWSPRLAGVRVADLLDPRLVVDIEGPIERDDVLSRLVVAGSAVGAIRDPAAVTVALRVREGVCSTALGGGVAFPHARGLSSREVVRPVIVIGRAEEGMAFKSLDGEATYLCLMVCAPDTEQQMRLLGRLSCLLQRTGVVAALRQATTAQGLVHILTTAEQELMGGESSA